jgi:tetratricopeptide (TPR) repeat protein
LQALLLRFAGDFRIHYEIAFTALLARRLEIAVQHFERALRFRPGDSTALYNLGCCWALKGDTERALSALGKSIDAGYHDLVHLQQDPDLASLRQDPRFSALLDRLSKMPAPTREP